MHSRDVSTTLLASRKFATSATVRLALSATWFPGRRRRHFGRWLWRFGEGVSRVSEGVEGLGEETGACGSRHEQLSGRPLECGPSIHLKRPPCDRRCGDQNFGARTSRRRGATLVVASVQSNVGILCNARRNSSVFTISRLGPDPNDTGITGITPRRIR